MSFFYAVWFFISILDAPAYLDKRHRVISQRVGKDTLLQRFLGVQCVAVEMAVILNWPSNLGHQLWFTPPASPSGDWRPIAAEAVRPGGLEGDDFAFEEVKYQRKVKLLPADSKLRQCATHLNHDLNLLDTLHGLMPSREQRDPRPIHNFNHENQ